MRKLFLLVSFALLCLYSFTQTNIQQDNRVNPLLKWAVNPKNGYSTYGRTGASRFINMAVLNQLSHTICWFTCHGRLFDSTKLNDQEFEQVISKQLDPFALYQNICDKYLADIAAAKDIYRVYGDNHLFDKLNGNYRALFAMESVQAAKTPLQNLVAIENVRKKILTQLAWLNCANPASLQNDPLYRVNKEQAGIMMKTTDSTVYYNIDPTSAVAKISLYKRCPEKLYVQNRQAEIIDSVPIQQRKYELLQQEKTDVFLLYRGWLEMQWQEAMGTIRKDAGEYQQVNIREEGYSQLKAVRTKINLLISPEAKCIEQVVYEAYRSETSEIYYMPLLGIGYNLVQTRGLKEYELTNHLGNVLATVSDKKIGVPSTSNSSLIDHYEPDVVSAQDYYPFGMLQPGRSLSSTGDKYRYGFNGKENDNEVKGEGNQQDYGMRVYDPRLGKFLSVDPLTRNFPYWTPYQFSGDNPVRYIDLDGAEQFDPSSIPKGVTHISVATAPGVYKQTQSIWIGNYELRGMVGENRVPYWIARYHFKEGHFKGGYNDEWVVGRDGIKDLAKNPEGYHNKSEWIWKLDIKPLNGSSLFEGWKDQVSNPINWIAGAGIFASGIKAAGRNLLNSNSEALVARGISGVTFTESTITKTLAASSEDMITLYRGTSGYEGGSGTLFLTSDAEYAAAYAKQNGLTVASYTVSRSGFNRLKNEGLISVGQNNGVLVNAEGKTISTGGEISVSNQTIRNTILKSKNP